LPANQGQWADEATEFCEFELAQGDISDDFWRDWLVRTVRGTLEQQRRRLALLDRSLALLKSPECRLSLFYRKHLLGQCERERHLRLHRYPELGLQPATPWQSLRVLVDFADTTNGLMQIASPLVHDGAVYFLGRKPVGKEKSMRLQLFRVGLKDGQLDLLNQASLPEQADGMIARHESFGKPCLANKCYTIAVSGVGIASFPLDGTSVRWITEIEGFSCNQVESLACVGDTLYACLGDRGCLLAYDLVHRQAEVIASSRRKQKQSPFDDGPPLHIPYMIADPTRTRLVYFAAVYGGQPGLWAYDWKTRSFQQLAEVCVDSHGNFWGSSTFRDRFIVGTNRGAILFDLRTDSMQCVLKTIFCFPEYRNPTYTANPNKLLDYLVWVSVPLLVQDGWLWHAQPWGRISLDGRREEDLVPLRKETADDIFCPDQCLEPVGDGDQILVGDRRGLWLLTLPEKTTKEKP